jgi:ATP-dependent RNA helicase DeaD
MTTEVATPITFADLHLSESILTALKELNYEIPYPIQAETIPIILAGDDIIGQAQTGTGKTAAFALPLLSMLQAKPKPSNAAHVQVLILTPTRELALQVTASIDKYAKYIPNVSVLPIYGGQDYSQQIRGLKKGVEIVVGTPGRIMDHMTKRTLDISNLQTLVLDEADEMLRMGFIDDIEWILEHTPKERQTVLFSATMPHAIQQVAAKYLTSPKKISIKANTQTAPSINQSYIVSTEENKFKLLSRILEAEEYNAVIIFAKTKSITTEIAEKLERSGLLVAALNGDLQQSQRENVIKRIKSGQIDIIVATDVAARGLDVDRITHVINYSSPHDAESYIHRIGRTGRAGRLGEAILLITPREKRMLDFIERTTKQEIKPYIMPSLEVINKKRASTFKQKITDKLAKKSENLQQFIDVLTEYQAETDISLVEIAAALALQINSNKPLFMTKLDDFTSNISSPYAAGSNKKRDYSRNNDRKDDRRSRERDNTRERDRERDSRNSKTSDRPRRERSAKPTNNADMQSYRIEVGYTHNVKPGNIVGAIINETGMNGSNIGNIEICDTYSIVDLPKETSKNIITTLKKVWVAGQQLNITVSSEKGKKSYPSKATANPKFSKKLSLKGKNT